MMEISNVLTTFARQRIQLAYFFFWTRCSIYLCSIQNEPNTWTTVTRDNRFTNLNSTVQYISQQKPARVSVRYFLFAGIITRALSIRRQCIPATSRTLSFGSLGNIYLRLKFPAPPHYFRFLYNRVIIIREITPGWAWNKIFTGRSHFCRWTNSFKGMKGRMYTTYAI